MRFSITSMAATLVLLTGLNCALADSVPWQSHGSDNELTFSVWYEGQELSGRFADFRVHVALDEAGTSPRTLTVEVDVGTADMKDREINAELAEPDWFDVASFPVSVFTSDEIRAADSGYVAIGTLRLKGMERDLEVPLNWERDGDLATLDGSTVLSRREWNIGTGEWASEASIADRVEVRYRVELAPER